MQTATLIRIIVFCLALLSSGILFLWIRPNKVRALSALFGGLGGALFFWAAGIYLQRWEVWSHIGGLHKIRLGGYIVDLLNVPLIGIIIAVLWGGCFCLLFELPSAVSEQSLIQKISPKKWLGIVVAGCSLLFAMATTFNCGLSWSLHSYIGSLTFFVALIYWLLFSCVALFVYWNSVPLLESGASIFDE